MISVSTIGFMVYYGMGAALAVLEEITLRVSTIDSK
jgi:hypothetical protein